MSNDPVQNHPDNQWPVEGKMTDDELVSWFEGRFDDHKDSAYLKKSKAPHRPRPYRRCCAAEADK